MELEEYKVEIVSDIKKADRLFSILSNSDLNYLELPALPLSAVKDFIDGKRSNLWEVVVNDESFLEVTADPESAAALLGMIKAAGVDEFPLAPLPVKNLKAFVKGQRPNVALLEIRKNTDVQVRVKPEEKKEAKKTKKR
jgi:hypothetical protein